MKFFVITFCLIFFSSLPSHSATYEWGQFNGWDVGVNQETNFGCYVLSPSYEDGSVIKLGFINLQSAESNFYLYLGNLNWSSLRTGEIIPMEINFFPYKSAYNGDAIVESVSGHNFLQFNIDDDDFLADFAKKDAIDFLYKGRSIAYLTLDGSYTALREFLNCQIAVAESGIANVALQRQLKKKNSRDPFFE